MEESSEKVLLDDPNNMSWKRKAIIALLLSFPVIAVTVYGIARSRSGAGDLGKVVGWETYREFDPQTNQMPPSLKALDGQKIRSPGFMVPLEDNRANVSEFLLVPNPQACIHAPPPPSNQMIYVRMVSGQAKTMFGPVMVEGTLRVSSQTHQYGTASFQIYGENVESYRAD